MTVSDTDENRLEILLGTIGVKVNLEEILKRRHTRFDGGKLVSLTHKPRVARIVGCFVLMVTPFKQHKIVWKL